MDAFRGWAVLGVVCCHIGAISPVPLNHFLAGLFRHGFAGVDLFFFISGFLLYIAFGKAYYEARQGPGFLAFYKRRALRIMPAYYFNLLALGLACVFSFPILSPYPTYAFVRHILFVHNLWAESVFSINGPLWTIPVEVQYYLILPFMASWFYGRRAVWAVAAIFLVSVVFRLWVSTLITQDLDVGLVEKAMGLLPGRLSQFAVGMFFANFWLSLENGGGGRFKFLKNKGLANVGVLLGLATCFLPLHLIVECYYGGLSGNRLFVMESFFSGIFAFACGLLVISTIYSSSPKILLANPAIEFLGIISYSVYLWHYPVIMGLKHYLPYLGLRPYMFVVFFMAGTIILSVLIGTFSYLALERPFLKRRHKRTPGG